MNKDLNTQKSNGWLKIYAKFYPILLGIFAFVGAVFWKDIRNNKKSFLIYTGTLCAIYYSWNIYVNNFLDITCWSFAKYAVTGISFFNVTLEDYLFYPICCWLFVIIAMRIDVNYFRNNTLYFRFSIILGFLVCLFFFNVDYIGKTITYFMSIPAFILANLFINRINVKHFLILLLISLAFSVPWDLHSTTWKPEWIGMTEWFYPRDARFFNLNSWTWIGNSPISITPYLTIAGFFLNYALYSILPFSIKDTK